MDVKQAEDCGFGAGVRVGPLEMKHLGCQASECELHTDGLGCLRCFLLVCFTSDQTRTSYASPTVYH